MGQYFMNVSSMLKKTQCSAKIDSVSGHSALDAESRG